MTHSRSKRPQSGTTLVETVVAATLIAVFFATIFELNAVCLRYIDASKESIAALQGVQDRVEALRNLAFTDLTNVGTQEHHRETLTKLTVIEPTSLGVDCIRVAIRDGATRPCAADEPVDTQGMLVGDQILTDTSKHIGNWDSNLASGRCHRNSIDSRFTPERDRSPSQCNLSMENAGRPVWQ